MLGFPLQCRTLVGDRQQKTWKSYETDMFFYQQCSYSYHFPPPLPVITQFFQTRCKPCEYEALQTLRYDMRYDETRRCTKSNRTSVTQCSASGEKWTHICSLPPPIKLVLHMHCNFFFGGGARKATFFASSTLLHFLPPSVHLSSHNQGVTKETGCSHFNRQISGYFIN